MIALHVIWTTYLTWPPGDSRGHWSALFDLYGQVKIRGGQLNGSDAITKEFALSIAKESPKLLTTHEQSIVADILGTHLSQTPKCHAAAIETNHVHLLIDVPTEPIDRCIGRLKGTSSSAVGKLSANAGRRRTWTSGYWKVFIDDQTAFDAIREYIENHNVRRGLPPTPYDWILR